MHKAKTIITVQHPESVHHTNGMIGSWTDWALTEKGRVQAKNIAINLQKETSGRQFSLYTSPLTRTKQTAEIIGEQLHITPIVVDALKERNLGKANGQSVQWLKENIETEEQTIYDKCFSDAESRFEVWLRIQSFYDRIISNEEDNIIIVSHGDTLSIFNILFLGLEATALNSINLYGNSGGLSFLHQTINGKRVIRRLSDLSFMCMK